MIEIEEKNGIKISILMTRTMHKKLKMICKKTGRSKSGLMRWVIERWLDAYEKQK